LRASLQHISQHLGSGDWHDAVQSLREDRLGAPSAFDALASGVEGALGESDRRWQALADLSADWYWETDMQGRLSWLSGSAPAVTLLGWTPADMMGRRRDELSFLEAPAHGWTALNEKMARHESFRDVEFRALARQNRHAVWVSISGRPRFDMRGDCVGYEGVGRNITERKAAHERLIASEQRWSLMAGLASDWYWQSDSEHRLLPLAPELVRRVPAFADRVVGRTRWEAHPDALTAEQWAEHRADLDAHRPFRSLQFETESNNGQWLWLSISGIPRFDGQGRFLGYHGVGRDITVRKQAERLLLRHNEALQRAVAERTRDLEQLNLDLDAFSRQLAHELRTPIGHVQGLAHLIETRAAGRLTGEERQLIALQVQAARSMRDTVDALMLLARSTVQAMPMEAVDIGALALQVMDELPLLERRAAVQWQVAPGLQAWGSASALRIVLANLMGNAAKFTRQLAAPQVSIAGSTDADGRLRVSVRDNGAGFDPAQAARLFQPFQRLHAGDDFHGTGIGLTIVQRIVERHGGRVAAEGAPGQGACFWFTLARGPADAPVAPR
ncbi:MAG: ATP-binding protein, partial [Rubrivivax sp.]